MARTALTPHAHMCLMQCEGGRGRTGLPLPGDSIGAAALANFVEAAEAAGSAVNLLYFLLLKALPSDQLTQASRLETSFLVSHFSFLFFLLCPPAAVAAVVQWRSPVQRHVPHGIAVGGSVVLLMAG